MYSHSPIPYNSPFFKAIKCSLMRLKTGGREHELEPAHWWVGGGEGGIYCGISGDTIPTLCFLKNSTARVNLNSFNYIKGKYSQRSKPQVYFRTDLLCCCFSVSLIWSS